MVIPFSASSGSKSVPRIDVARLVLGAGVVEDALRRGGFPGVHVSDDANVPQFLDHGQPAAQLRVRPKK